MMVRNALLIALCLGLVPAVTSACNSGSEVDGQYVLVSPSARDLKLLSMKPESGPLAGGTLVVIAGEGLRSDMSVTFGGVEGAQLAVGGDELAVVRTPPGTAAGAVDVAVTRADGQTASFAHGFTYDPAPDELLVLEVTPGQGGLSGGMDAVVIGRGFEDGATVLFGDSAASSVRVLASDSLVATVPAGAAVGFVDVTVRLAAGSSQTLAQGFRYVDEGIVSKLNLVDVIPNAGPLAGGSTITIAGGGFVDGATASLGGVACTNVRVIGDSAITAVTPRGLSPGLVDLRVELPATDSDVSPKSASLADAYRYEPAPALAVLSVTPSSGALAGGGTITIEGRGFVDGATVKLGGVAATDVRVLGGSAITATAPQGNGPGLVDVRVDLPGDGGTASASAVLDDGYRYVPADGLAILGVIPPSGALAGGNIITLQGTGFVDGASVFIAGRACSDVRVLGDSGLTCTAPASDTAGAVTVRVELPNAASATLVDGYRYEEGPPPLLVLRAIPATGPLDGGNTVTLEGTGFRAGAKVFLGGAPATDVAVLASTALTATAPAQADSGPVDVRVELPPLAGATTGPATTLEDGYTYQFGEVSTADLGVASLYPTQGGVDGGALVLITGTGFDSAMVVRFGAVQSPLVQVLSTRAATALVPAGSAGAVDVTVRNPDGSDVVLSGAFRYLAADVVDSGQGPALGAVVPSRGPTTGGTLTRIVGANFGEDLKVTFGATEATAVAVLAPGLAIALTPPGDVGATTVRVADGAGRDSSLTGGFTYAAASATPPTISATWPPQGPATGGTWVAIDGANLAAGSQVYFGMQPASDVRFVSGTRLLAVAPPASVGTVDLTVVRPDGETVARADAFAYFDPSDLPADPPVIGAVSPPVGSIDGGQAVHLVGSAFAAGSRVFFGTAEATVTDATSTSAWTVRAPAHPGGTVAVTIVTPDGLTHVKPDVYTYIAAPPLIRTVSPTTGNLTGGYTVTIAGKNFQPGAVVNFGGVTISTFTTATATSLAFLALPSVQGNVDVVVTNPDGQFDMLPNAFVYLDGSQSADPVVSGVDPAQGAAGGGYLALVHGQNFEPGAAVKFGAAPGTQVEWLSDTLLKVQVPGGAENSSVDVVVTNSPGHAGTLASGFRYNAATVAPLVVAKVSPGVGSTDGGTVLTIEGTGFQAGTTVLIGTTPALGVNVVSPTTITAVTPPGSAGLASVRLERPDLSAVTAFNAFAYLAAGDLGHAPRLTDVDPAVGPMAGGSLVLLSGARFDADARVYFGATEATHVTFIDAGRLSVRTPARGLSGSVAVSVVNGDGTVGVLPGGYSYYDASGAVAPQVFLTQPGSGSTFGDELVTVLGRDIRAGARAYFCGHPADSVGLAGTTSLDVVTPPVEPGACDVVVTNPDGLSAGQTEAFEYLAPTPSVTSVLPSSGPKDGGIDIIVRGDGFVRGAEVRFGLAASQLVTVADRGTLTARLPAHDVGVVDVTVVNPGASAASGTLSAGFTYVDSVGGVAPTVSDVFPSAGPLAGGTPVRVVGTDFEPTSLVIFDGRLAQITVVSSAEIRFETPPRDTAGVVSMTVLNPSGLGTTVASAFTYTPPTSPAPSITQVSPANGPEQGGNTLNFIGANFRVTGRWLLGGVALTGVNTLNENLVSVQAPAHAPGRVDLTYVGPDGQVATRVEAYQYLAAPLVTSAAPGLGAVTGDTQVELVGNYFTTGMKVFFGGVQGTVLSVGSATNATVRTPPSVIPGFVDIVVRNPDGQEGRLAAGFEYLAPPSLAAVWPSQGPSAGGTVATLTGSGFHRDSRVYFGGTEASAVYYTSQGGLLAFVPEASSQSVVEVRVDNPDGASFALPAAFTYKDPSALGPKPTISAMFPSRGPTTGGTRIGLSGTNFSANGRAFVLPAPATVEIVRGDRAIVVAPPGAAGETDVWWTNPDGWSVRSPETFTWLDPSLLGATPTITTLTPASGATGGGTVAALSGTGFQSNARVRFGADDGTVDAIASDHVDLHTPAHSRGAVDVWLINPDGTQVKAPAAYLFLAPPTAISLAPAKGPASGGTHVVITGRDLHEDPDGALPTVVFCQDYAAHTDCAVAAEADVSLSADAKQLTVATPVHLPGIVDVAVVAPDNQAAVLTGAFTYTQLPTVTGISPDGGPTAGGQLVTIAGSGFQPGLGVRVAGKPCTSVNVTSASELTCLTPANAVGVADVIVTNADGGTVTAAGAYTYVSPPILDRLTPNYGAQGVAVETTLQGRGFSPQAEVFFATTPVPAGDILSRSTTTIHLRVPLLQGSVDVIVRNPDGQESRLIDGFSYTPPQQAPTVLYVTPRTGLASGGQVFRVAGANFLEGLKVEFGKAPDWVMAPADSLAVKNSGTLISGVTPEHGAGIVDVQVTNTDGRSVVLANAFEFIPAPDQVPLGVINISPSRAMVAGGGWLTLTGTGFAPNAKVTFKQGAAASPIDGVEVQHFGPTLMRAWIAAAPTGAAGPADIIVTNPGTFENPELVTVTVTGRFEYIAGPLFQRHPGDRLGNNLSTEYRAFVVDVNGDGYNDVFVTGSSDHLLINRGEIQPGWFDEQSFPGGSSTDNLYPFDYDEDGDIDLVRQVGNSLQYCENQGGGSFASCTNINTSSGGFGKVAMGDLNCDARPDFFLPASSSSYKNRIVINLGGGRFSTSDAALPNDKESSTSASIADVDGDGDNDILIGQTSSYINRLYLNNCANLQLAGQCQMGLPGATTGAFGGHTYAMSDDTYDQASAEGFCHAFKYDGLVRVDSEAEEDFLKATFVNQSYWLALTDPDNDNSFDWTRAGDTSFIGWCNSYPTTSASYRCAYLNWHSSPSNRCVRNYPCDNAFRAVCESSTPACSSAWAFSNVTYGTGKLFPQTQGDTRDVLLVDIDVDGRPDAIISYYDNPTQVFMNTGGAGQSGTLFLQSFERWPTETGTQRDRDELIPVDIDDDGDLDIIARRGTDEVQLYINDRYTINYRQFDCQAPADCSCNPCSGEICDSETIDGPGDFTNETATRWPNGTGRQWRTGLYSSGRPFGVGDLDGDGYPDMYVAGQTEADRMIMNCGYEEGLAWTDANRVGIGHFRFNTYRALPESNAPMTTALMGDFDGDGSPDIFRCGSNGQTWQLWMNDGAGKWSDESATKLPALSYNCVRHGATVADLDGDGDLDIMVEASNGRAQLVNDGYGNFTNRATPNLPSGYSTYVDGLMTADFDDDGDPDWLIFATYSTSNLSDVFINGGDAFNVGGAYGIDQTAAWLTGHMTGLYNMKAAVVVDINHDRFPDLYVGVSGVNRAWLNVDGQYFIDAETAGPSPESLIHQGNTSTNWLLADDFDLDGDLDILDLGSGQNHYHVRDGDNGYFDRTDLMPEVSNTSYGGDTGDIDGDGLPDAYIANYGPDQMLIATASGFTDFSTLLPPVRSNKTSYQAYLVDVDGDCDLDVYVLNNGDQDRIYINTLNPPCPP